jgi:hypothetical protein
MLRVESWIFRFIQYILRAHKLSGELASSELTQARLHWIRVVQAEGSSAELDAIQRNVGLHKGSKVARLNPFLQDGLIRLGWRLQYADLPEALVTLSCLTVNTALFTC